MRWRYFPLHPDTPQEGLLLTDLFAGRGLDLDAMHSRMKRLMDGEGLSYNRRTHTYNSRLAQELAKWADSRGFESLHGALYRAYFVDARNIGDPDVLLDVSSSLRLPLDEVRDILERRTFEKAVDADWEKARISGITGVPSFLAHGSKVVGAQPYEVLADWLTKLGARPK